jgi:hypothetical protein
MTMTKSKSKSEKRAPKGRKKEHSCIMMSVTGDRGLSPKAEG